MTNLYNNTQTDIQAGLKESASPGRDEELDLNNGELSTDQLDSVAGGYTQTVEGYVRAWLLDQQRKDR